MRPCLALVATIGLMLLSVNSYAGTFIVTSNSNTGPGTLREAIQRAAANGTASTDTIIFNLPDISRTGRTIILDSSLPTLSSHIIIDGTTQPGSSFGISDARVQIENNTPSLGFKCFDAFQVTDIEIYGLYFKGGPNAQFVLEFRQSDNIRVGAPGKGNLVTGYAQAFYADIRNIADRASNNLTFQANLLGIDESGDVANYSTYNSSNFSLINVNNLLIGGLKAGEGNLMCDQALSMAFNCYRPDDSGYLKIEGNKIGTDRTGLKRLINTSQGFDLNGFNDGNGSVTGTTNITVDIINNISAEPFSLVNFKNLFTIQGNRFGVGADNITNIGQNSYCLIIDFCAGGIIGGPNNSDKNYIANFTGMGISEFWCGSITISKNSFFCNGHGIDYNWMLNRPMPFVSINTISATQVAGTALPYSTIELFYDDECPGCEGKTYIASVTADATGNWKYNGNNSGGIVATATDIYGATSFFSSATINTDSVIIRDATCGKSNGSIKKLRVVSGTDWYWEDEQGNIAGRNIDLINLAPGKYKFVTSVGGNSCKTESLLYEVKNIDKPSIDTSYITIIQPSCGLSNGGLKNESVFNDSFEYRWLNNSGQILSGNYSLNNPFTNLAAADYYLNVRLKLDTTCFIQNGPFILTNQSGPSLKTGAMQTGKSTCGRNNGFIKNISYQNATGNVYIAWEDSTGTVVSNNIDLAGMARGKYLLKFKDGSNCDTIVTPYFIIKDTGTISVDTTHMLVKESSCNGADGAVTGITSINAMDFTWINVASGSITGNSEDITYIAAGSYRLQCNNSLGCEATIGPVRVNHYGFLADTVLDVNIADANCDVNNGYVKINRFSNDPSFYSFEWKDSATNNVISTTTSIQDLSPGFYMLSATDNNGCKQQIFEVFIQQIGKPAFDIHAMQILSDTCNSGRGTIRNLLTKDPLRSYTWAWYDGRQRQVGFTANDLRYIHSGDYYATVTDQFNCTVISNIFTIDNREISPAAPKVADQYIPRNTAATIPVINPQKGIYELLGDNLPGSLPLDSSAIGRFHTSLVTADRSFYIQLRDGDCTSALSLVNIKVFDSTIIYVPNAFTPNNDGVNDRLGITVLGNVIKFSISIYNRWGNLVYSGTNIHSSWDGTMKGQNLPVGLFVYIINATDYNNKNINQKGTIMLIR